MILMENGLSSIVNSKPKKGGKKMAKKAAAPAPKKGAEKKGADKKPGTMKKKGC